MVGRVRLRRALAALRARGRAGTVRMAHAVVVVAWMELALRTLRLPRVCALLGIRPEFAARTVPTGDDAVAAGEGRATTADPGERTPGAPALAPSERALLGEALTVLARSPLPGTCLRRALVAGLALRGHDTALQIGVHKSGGTVSAHAWLIVDGVNLDPSGSADFTPLVQR